MKWLAEAFGFQTHGPQMTGPDGKVQHAEMQFRDAIIMMGCPGADYKNPKRLGQVTQYLYVMVDDVDEHFKRASKAGGKVLEEPADTEYGHRRYGVEDPEGHQWYFAQELKSTR
jgi:uncharacterized glyoxalase superfamily protein PhnB